MGEYILYMHTCIHTVYSSSVRAIQTSKWRQLEQGASQFVVGKAHSRNWINPRLGRGGEVLL